MNLLTWCFGRCVSWFQGKSYGIDCAVLGDRPRWTPSLTQSCSNRAFLLPELVTINIWETSRGFDVRLLPEPDLKATSSLLASISVYDSGCHTCTGSNKNYKPDQRSHDSSWTIQSCNIGRDGVNATHTAPRAKTAVTAILRLLAICIRHTYIKDKSFQAFKIELMSWAIWKKLTIGIGMITTMRSMMKSEITYPPSKGTNATQLNCKVLTEIHHAENVPLHAKRNVKKIARVHDIMTVIITKLAIPKALYLSIKKIRRQKNTKLSLINPKWRTCII